MRKKYMTKPRLIDLLRERQYGAYGELVIFYVEEVGLDFKKMKISHKMIERDLEMEVNFFSLRNAYRQYMRDIRRGRELPHPPTSQYRGADGKERFVLPDVIGDKTEEDFI